jgi:tryptophan-rich sensory protein
MNAAISMRTVVLLVVCAIICFAPGIVGSQFRPGQWYDTMRKPALTPPGWVFPVVWNLLYLMMAVALFLVLRKRGIGGAPVAVALFAIQLILNGVWSWLFFGLHRPDLSLIEIGMLWLFILLSMIAFWRVRPLAGALLLPYFAWVSFASYLNFQFWSLNR